MRTFYVCSRCGETSEDHNLEGWLIVSVPYSKSGEMVIRCPEHITRYAIYKAGGRIEAGKGIIGFYEYEVS